MAEPKDPLSDFRAFLFLVWKHLNLTPSDRQYQIAQFLQKPIPSRRKVIMAFRGFGKSWITAAYVLWRLYLDPSINVLVVSASKARADNFTTFLLRLISEIDQLRHLMPKEGQRCSKVSFDVGPAPPMQTPSVMSLGITSQISGNRADIVVSDDVEVPNNSATQMMREKLSEAIKEFEAVLKPLPTSEIIFLGTPQTEDSIYKKLEDRGYVIRIWPVRYPTNKQRLGYGPRLAPDIARELKADPLLVGKPTEPRFNERDLVEREASYGRAGFALQFMLDTTLADVDRYPLKLSDLIFTDLDPAVAPEKVIYSSHQDYLINNLPNVGLSGDHLYRPMKWDDVAFRPYEGVVMSIDPSGRGRDETAYAVVAHLCGQLFLLDAGGFSEGYTPKTLRALADIAAKFRVNRILIEANFGDGMFTALLKPTLAAIYPCSTEEVKHSTQKEKRIIDTLEPVMASHRLVVNIALVRRDYDSTLHRPTEGREQEIYRLFYQLTRLTRDRGALLQDDRVDALSIAVAYFTSRMQQDIDLAIGTRKSEDLEKALRNFMDHALSRKSSTSKVWNTR